jgi:hypothetical protein
MPKTNVDAHNRRRDDIVIPVRKHLREVPGGKDETAGVARGPSVGSLQSVQEVDFEALQERVELTPTNWRVNENHQLKTHRYKKSVEMVFVGAFGDGVDNYGKPRLKGFSVVNTDEPLGRETAIAFLEEAVRREYGPDAEIAHSHKQYQRWVKDRHGRFTFDTSELPEWLQEDDPRVPADEVLAAAEYFSKKTKGTPLQGKTVVLSGEFPDMKRDDATLFLETLGANVASGVSKKVDVLIADPNSSSSKVKKAQALGIPVVAPEEVMECPNDNLAAWRTEMYRRHRLGTPYSYGDKYQSGPTYDRNVKGRQDTRHLAKTHEEAIAAAESAIACIHLWSATRTIDTRADNPVLRTGAIIAIRECERCGKEEQNVKERFNWSGD